MNEWPPATESHLADQGAEGQLILQDLVAWTPQSRQRSILKLTFLRGPDSDQTQPAAPWRLSACKEGKWGPFISDCPPSQTNATVGSSAEPPCKRSSQQDLSTVYTPHGEVAESWRCLPESPAAPHHLATLQAVHGL